MLAVANAALQNATDACAGCSAIYVTTHSQHFPTSDNGEWTGAAAGFVLLVAQLVRFK